MDVNTQTTAPSAGAPPSSPPSGLESSPSPSVDSSQLTDTGTAIQQPTGAEPQAAPESGPTTLQPGAQTQAGEQGQPGLEPADRPLSVVLEPQEFKEAFKLPGIGSKLRDQFYQLAAYREVMPTVAEARALREELPDGIESLQAMRQDLSDFGAHDAAFDLIGTDPAGEDRFFAGLHQADAQRAVAFLKAAPRLLAQHDPVAYHQHVSAGVAHVLEQLAQTAIANGDENGLTSIDIVCRRFFKQPYQENLPQRLAQRNGQDRTDPRLTQLAQREQRLKEQEQALAMQHKTEFVGRCDSQIDSQISGMINTELDRLLPKTLNKASREKIYREIEDDVRTKVSGNPRFAQHLRQMIDSGSMDQAHEKSVVSTSVNRARFVVSQSTARVVNEWTTGVFAMQPNQQPAAPDLGRGASSPQPGSAAGQDINMADIDYSRTSNEMLMQRRAVLKSTGKEVQFR